ncbi:MULTISPECIES: hypothetical protein [Pseudomonas]|uniref:hypothetical protein n=1 Tax=Pseudomonas TaxID=286 RepID=UPI0015E43FE5|nr:MULTISPECIES: hypothetical protein [Pseudomonas]MBA1244734.1 hypothetical protein [Pseudomonas japonica]MBA1290251.1 hypothetical protein [Pseudomonas japonica]
MNTKIKTALVYGTAGALVVTLYGASVYRVEQLRTAQRSHTGCSYALCISQNPSFSSLR